MNRYLKISAALAAFALLLVVMGLSTQPTVQAQASTVTITVGGEGGAEAAHIRSCDPYPNRTDAANLGTPIGDSCPVDDDGDNEFSIAFEDGTGPVEIYNTSLPTSGDGAGNDDNPRKFAVNTEVPNMLFAVSRTSGLRNTEIKAFSGNVIRVSFRPGGTLGVVKTLTVDNVAPALVANSPTTPLIVKGSTNIVFSADATDSGSGYSDDATKLVIGAAAAGQIDADNTTMKGMVRLVVAGNIVPLAKGDFSAIDGGWQVTKAIDSSSIQDISANVPWFFESKDRAGNVTRTAGSFTGSPSGNSTSNTMLVDTRFAGTLGTNTFEGDTIKLTRGTTTIEGTIGAFAFGDSTFTINWGSPSVFVFEDDTDTTGVNESTAILASDKYEILNTNLITVDSKAPKLASGDAITTGKGRSGGKEVGNRKNSIKVEFADDGKNDNDNAGSDLDSDTVNAASFTVAGNSVNRADTVGNNVYLTLAENLGSTEKPRVTIAGGLIKDKAGNAFGGESDTANDGLGPNLSLSKSGDLSKTKVDITITTDEQLKANPSPTLTGVGDADGTLIAMNTMVCLVGSTGADALTIADDAAFLPADSTAGTLDRCNTIDDEGDATADAHLTAEVGVHPAAPRATGSVTQSTALSYKYAISAAAILASDKVGGKFNVVVAGADTQGAEGNSSSIGNKKSANNVGAFTFQLDRKLNGNVDPVVKVGESIAVGGDGDVPDVEAIDNLIVTIDFAGETGEYAGDSYRTVDLTLAELTITFKDGTSEKTTFNLTTDVNSPDNIQFTVALLNPKVGNYSLKVQATDSAGNKSGTAGHVSRWEVVSARPVPINLQPGWNMISLPFQPGNPAINSVIPSTHPADIVMTFDGPTQTWLVSRRDAESGLFSGDIAVMTASTAYFVRTTNFQALSILRPPIATNAAPPPQIPALAVVKGWNLIPIVSNASPLPKTIPADEYFGTLANSGNSGWLKAITFNTLARTWEDVTPGEKVQVYEADGTAKLDDGKPVFEPATVKRGKGYWLYATGDGVIIP